MAPRVQIIPLARVLSQHNVKFSILYLEQCGACSQNEASCYEYAMSCTLHSRHRLQVMIYSGREAALDECIVILDSYLQYCMQLLQILQQKLR